MNNTSTKRKAAIIGGSLGGLFAANLLLRNGWDVDVFERVPDELSGRGAGIVTHAELFDVMQAADV
ncbi:NAD(P)-binding protein, partial [Paraburkholderia sp. SIMBA_053]